MTLPQTQSLIILETISANNLEIDSLERSIKDHQEVYTEDNLEISEFTKRNISEKIADLEKENSLLNLELRKLGAKVGITVPKDLDSNFVHDYKEAIIGGNQKALSVAEIARLQQRWILKAGASNQVEPVFLHTRRVLAGTCLGFLSNRNVRELNFDVCIIDEASKASIPESLVPMTKAKRTILVGDSSQLSPGEYLLNPQDRSKVTQKFQLAPEDFDNSLIAHLEDSMLMNDSQYASLDIQYRMRDEIGKLISHLFYEGKLRSVNATTDKIKLGLLMGAVDWIDTGAKGLSRSSENRVGDSFSNRFEIDAIKDKLKILNNALGTIIKPEGKLSVLIIAPYVAQVDLARTHLQHFNNAFLDVQFNTIDAVQGREADIVFFSTVRNNSQGKTGFLSAKNWRRINVALSRARLNLTIVGNLGFWESSDSALSQVVKFLRGEAESNSLYRIQDVETYD
jgi:superfamily I DNA and/or RNA helicase